jgi:hypothetical protein
MVPKTEKKPTKPPYTVEDLEDPRPGKKKRDYIWLLNPKNWGVENLGEEESFGAAFKKARKEGLNEFIYNGRRYNTKSNESSSTQMKKFGNTNTLLEYDESDQQEFREIADFLHRRDSLNRDKGTFIDDLLNLHRKSGDPSIGMEENRTPMDRSKYNPALNRMKLYSPNHYLDELAHAVQEEEDMEYFGQAIKERIQYGDDGRYKTKGTIEYQAHKEIAPALRKKLGLYNDNSPALDSIYRRGKFAPIPVVKPTNPEDFAPDEREGGVPFDWDEEAYYDSLEKAKKKLPKKEDGGVIPKMTVRQDATRVAPPLRPEFGARIPQTAKERALVKARNKELQGLLETTTFDEVVDNYDKAHPVDMSKSMLPSDFKTKEEYYNWYEKSFGRPQRKPIIYRGGGKLSVRDMFSGKEPVDPYENHVWGAGPMIPSLRTQTENLGKTQRKRTFGFLNDGGKLVGPSHEQNGILAVDPIGRPVAEVEGGERLFSVEDSAEIEKLARGLKNSPKKAALLGRRVSQMIKTQDKLQNSY